MIFGAITSMINEVKDLQLHQIWLNYTISPTRSILKIFETHHALTKTTGEAFGHLSNTQTQLQHCMFNSCLHHGPNPTTENGVPGVCLNLLAIRDTESSITSVKKNRTKVSHKILKDLFGFMWMISSLKKSKWLSKWQTQ